MTSRAITPAVSLDWQIDSLCREADPELFHSVSPVDIREAKQICAACPVKSECLSAALARGEQHGVWGGLDEDERRNLRRRVQRQRPAEPLDPASTTRAVRRPVVEWVLGAYPRVVELRSSGWGRRRIAEALRVSADSLTAADRLVAAAGSAEAALDKLVVAA